MPQPVDRCLFIAYSLLLIWVPLPFGSKRAWAWELMEIGIFLMACAWLVLFALGKVSMPRAFRKAWPLHSVCVLWLLYLVFQQLPLPLEWLQALTPTGLEIQQNFMLSGTLIANPVISLDPYVSYTKFSLSIAYITFFWLTLLLVNSRKRIKILAYVIIFSALFQAVYGALMAMVGLEWNFSGSARGTFYNRNHLAAYLYMALAIGTGLLISSLGATSGNTLKQKSRNLLKLFFSEKIRLRIYLAIMVIGLVMTHSRMGNTAFFAALSIAGVIGLILSRHATKSTVILLASLIIIDIFILGAWFGVDKVAKRIEQTTLQTEIRDEANDYSLVHFKDYFLAGSGIGTYYTVFPSYANTDMDVFFKHAHNDYLEFSTEHGVIGIALLGFIVGSSLLVALIAQYKRRDTVMRGLSFAAIMAIIGSLIHATVEFNFQIPANVLTYMVILSFAWIALFHRSRKQTLLIN